LAGISQLVDADRAVRNRRDVIVEPALTPVVAVIAA
jgi:hypothetical protein